jgi:hypothetical protein
VQGVDVLVSKQLLASSHSRTTPALANAAQSMMPGAVVLWDWPSGNKLRVIEDVRSWH